MVTVDGVALKVSIGGHAGRTPLLLISGIGAPLELWEPFRRAVGLETIAVDAPGVGGSANLRGPRTMWQLAGMFDTVMDQLGYGTVDVLGLSWGGGVAQHLAIRHPGRVRRLVLANTGYGLWSIPGDPRAALQLMTPARYFSRRHLLAVGPGLYGGETRRHPERLQAESAVRSARRPSTRGYVNQLAAAWTWVGLPLLPFIQQPTLVLAGDDDPIVHVATGRIMAALLPEGRLHIAKGAGHLFLLDQAEEAAAIVKSFVSTGRRGTPSESETS